MNPAFWIIALLIMFLIWWFARRWFNKIGRSAYNKYDEISDIVSQEDIEEPPIYESYDYDSFKEEFKEYMANEVFKK